MPLPFVRGQLAQVSYRVINFGAEVRKVWGEEWSKKDIVYEFSNGRRFQDPTTAGGPYKQP